jgi:hypothetical protein
MGNTYKSQRSLLRALALSVNVQPDFAAALADAAFTYTALMETNNFAVIDPEYESDYQYSGKGHSFATDSRMIAVKSSADISTRVDQFLAGWFLAMVMGKVQTTGAAEPYTHTITWEEANNIAKATNLYVEDTEGLKRKFLDMCLTQLVLSGAEKGSITAKASFLGSGRANDGALATGVPARIQHPQFLYGSDAIISIGPVGAPVSMFPRVLSWEATFDRAIEEQRSPGGGLYAAFLRYGNPTCKLKLVIAADETTDVRDWAKNQTDLEVKIAIHSGAAQLEIDYPYVHVPKDGLGETNKYVSYTVDLDQNTIMKPADGEVCTVKVTNTTAAYLTAAA